MVRERDLADGAEPGVEVLRNAWTLRPWERVVRPVLPDHVNHVEIRRLGVGEARADLRFERAGEGIEVKVLKVDGTLDVAVET